MRRLKHWLLPAAIAAVLVPLAACKNNGQPAGGTSATSAPARTATVTVAAEQRKLTFRVELALTADEQTRGLMYRQSLAPDAGMLFVFDRQSVHAFWTSVQTFLRPSGPGSAARMR